MKLTHPDLEYVPDTDGTGIPVLVIEEPKFFRSFLSDLFSQTDGLAGRAVLSINDAPVDMSKYLEIIDRFVPFEINRKPLLTKILTALEKTAMDEDHFLATREWLASIEKYIDNLAFSEDCDILCSKISVSPILRAVGVELQEQYGDPAEKILDYMELVRHYDRDKLFVTVNIRSFFSDKETAGFMKTARSHGFHLLMLESVERPRLPLEDRHVVDRDLCEI